jgi:hypothetical protein
MALQQTRRISPHSSTRAATVTTAKATTRAAASHPTRHTSSSTVPRPSKATATRAMRRNRAIKDSTDSQAHQEALEAQRMVIAVSGRRSWAAPAVLSWATSSVEERSAQSAVS